MITPPHPAPSAPSVVKPRFPEAVALAVAAELSAALRPACERIEVAGSLRRRKPTVGDVELLYISRTVEVMDGFFDIARQPAVEGVLVELLGNGVLAMRRNKNGSTMWGPSNKYAIHTATGLPVDLFAATAVNWWNYLVCRTGPAASNTRICMAAHDLGWKWNPYGAGYTREDTGEIRAMGSEEEVFAFVGLPYAAPEDRR